MDALVSFVSVLFLKTIIAARAKPRFHSPEA